MEYKRSRPRHCGAASLALASMSTGDNQDCAWALARAVCDGGHSMVSILDRRDDRSVQSLDHQHLKVMGEDQGGGVRDAGAGCD